MIKVKNTKTIKDKQIPNPNNAKVPRVKNESVSISEVKKI